MSSTSTTGMAFYQSLGKLFYAIAAVDSNVRTAEVAKLKQFVRKYWLEVDELNDEFYTDAAYQIEIVFDWLHEKDVDAYECFTYFKEFYLDHEELFPSYIKQLVYDTASAIAGAFAKKNKAEVIMLSKLKALYFRM